MTLFFLNERQWHIHIAEFNVFLFNSFFFFLWEMTREISQEYQKYSWLMQPLSLSWGTNFFYTSEDLWTSLLKYKRSLKQDQSTSIKLTPWQSRISHIGKTFFSVSRKNPLILTLIPLSHFFLFTLTTWPFFTAPIYLFIKSNE